MPLGAAILGLLEGSLVLLPMEPLFVPVMIARRRRVFWIAAFLLIGNVLGGALMYGLGALAAEPLIEPIVSRLGALERYRAVSAELRENGFIALFLVGITPFPFQLGTAAAGAVGYGFAPFLAAVTLSRGIRYFALAGLVALAGARLGDFMERHETSFVLGGAVVFTVAGLWALL
jgi:membrane protein YqaA with SNARE-associated domain